jgi:hypothetical protein
VLGYGSAVDPAISADVKRVRDVAREGRLGEDVRSLAE